MQKKIIIFIFFSIFLTLDIFSQSESTDLNRCVLGTSSLFADKKISTSECLQYLDNSLDIGDLYRKIYRSLKFFQGAGNKFIKEKADLTIDILKTHFDGYPIFVRNGKNYILKAEAEGNRILFFLIDEKIEKQSTNRILEFQLDTPLHLKNISFYLENINFSNLGKSYDLSKEGIGVQIFSHLGKILPMNIKLSMEIGNKPTRQYISDHCYIGKRGEIRFKKGSEISTDDYLVVETVEKELQLPNSLSISSIFSQTLIPRLIRYAGFTPGTLSHFKVGSREATGLQALKILLESDDIISSFDLTAFKKYYVAGEYFTKASTEEWDSERYFKNLKKVNKQYLSLQQKDPLKKSLFFSTNEYDWSDGLPYITGKSESYIGVALGGQNLSYLAQGNYDHAIMMDYNHQVIELFMPIRFALINRSETRADFIAALYGISLDEKSREKLKYASIKSIKKHIDRLVTKKSFFRERTKEQNKFWEQLKHIFPKELQVIAHDFWRSHIKDGFSAEKMLYFMDQKGSWLSNEYYFNRVKSMVQRNTITGICGSIADQKIMHYLSAQLKQGQKSVSTIYTSNVAEWTGGRQIKKAVELLPLSSEGILIQSLILADNGVKLPGKTLFSSPSFKVSEFVPRIINRTEVEDFMENMIQDLESFIQSYPLDISRSLSFDIFIRQYFEKKGESSGDFNAYNNNHFRRSA